MILFKELLDQNQQNHSWQTTNIHLSLYSVHTFSIRPAVFHTSKDIQSHSGFSSPAPAPASTRSGPNFTIRPVPSGSRVSLGVTPGTWHWRKIHRLIKTWSSTKDHQSV
jgi:hypothetical protein